MKECPKCNSQNIKTFNVYDFNDVFECVNCNYFFSHKIDDCCRNPDKILVIEYFSNDNSRRLINQCLNCGGAFKKDKFAFKSHGNLIESEFSETNFTTWTNNRKAENSIISEQYDVFRKSKFYKYHIYLKSNEWKIIRDKVVERDSGKCLYCKTKPAQEVHHKHYRNIYKESIEDLESVCSDCHREIHKSIFPARASVTLVPIK